MSVLLRQPHGFECFVESVVLIEPRHLVIPDFIDPGELVLDRDAAGASDAPLPVRDDHPMVKNRFVVEVGDTTSLKNCVTRLRNVDSVFDAYRVVPGG